MIGYSGTGYRGLQLMPDQPTIEGDLFTAFVAAGAISKANADDPKKSGLSRCARTDKGVHAAGNVLSLKMIIEDPDIVQKINDKLDPRIRVWGIQRTTGGFNCYTACDSRWYEYLIPSSAFLPPHPSTWLASEVLRIATEDGKLDYINEKQKDVADFWAQIEKDEIVPILETLDPEMRERIEEALYKVSSMDTNDADQAANLLEDDDPEDKESGNEKEAPVDVKPESENQPTIDTEFREKLLQIRSKYIAAKKAYRISKSRLDQVKEALKMYQGTHNYHNFTIRKSANDPSSKRFIKSFKVNGDPVLINDSEWISLKVHGQSFMMHQIRKMVAMAALVVRCGTPLERFNEGMSKEVMNIPKAPSLGLLLERPVFESYTAKAKDNNYEPVDFVNYEKEMLAFKQSQIYDRIFEEEEKSNT
jgi:tRNA pseudouridine38-40 synthase